jgi:hypothetical protein
MREVRVEAVEHRARLDVVVEGVTAKAPDAQHRRHVARPFVAPDQARRLALVDQALEIVDGGLRAAELLVEQARLPQRIVEERARVRPAIGDVQVSVASGDVLA